MPFDFKIPDLISGWRNASLLQRVTIAVSAALLSYLGGFSFAAGSAWAAGATVLAGLGQGLIWGACCLFSALVMLGFPVAYPKQAIDGISEVQGQQGKK